ncbi:MAG TPA: cyclase family protein [Gaiellaceae bacterium]|nr:cyclase family protein [Gaiellaceae bacterium]
MELIDVTVPVRPEMPIYEGNPGVRLTRVQTIEEGATSNVSELELGVHTGTHVDAPLHFIEGGEATETLPLEVLIGPAEVVDGTSLEGPIDAESLARLELPKQAERLILKTRNSELWARSDFTRDFSRLTADGARLLIGRGARLVALDYLSIGDADAHRVLLGSGVVALEGLDLRAVEPGAYELVCLPLRLVGSDGAPARVVLMRPGR